MSSFARGSSRNLLLVWPLKPWVYLNGRSFRVEYEGLQLICFNCGKFGHRVTECPQLAPLENNDGSARDGSAVDGPSSEAPFGPWMIAPSRRRRVTGTPGAPTNDQGGSGPTDSGIGQATNSPRAQSGNNTTMGSRFNVLAEDKNGTNDVMEVEELREQLAELPNQGATPTVRMISRDSTSAKQARPSGNRITQNNKGATSTLAIDTPVGRITDPKHSGHVFTLKRPNPSTTAPFQCGPDNTLQDRTNTPGIRTSEYQGIKGKGVAQSKGGGETCSKRISVHPNHHPPPPPDNDDDGCTLMDSEGNAGSGVEDMQLVDVAILNVIFAYIVRCFFNVFFML